MMHRLDLQRLSGKKRKTGDEVDRGGEEGMAWGGGPGSCHKVGLLQPKIVK